MRDFPRSTSRWLPVVLLVALFVLAGAFVFSMLPGIGIPVAAPSVAPLPTPSPTRDPVLRLPGFAEYIKKYPTDWEKRLDPSARPMIEFQRMIGEHGTVTGVADNQANPSYPNPKFRVFIMDWDGTDLFAIGVVKTYNGKPVELVPVEGPTKPLGN